ncbi:MAG: hypothetical protein HYY76_04800 [Acidobacteria bacterium]|nr:hypothetical protein [Acidobacteriota bacterium]
MGILESLQNSGFATWVRESPSLLAYQLYITLHAIGLGMVVGISAGICFRILGVAAALPLAPMEKYLRFMWIGFWVNAVSGVVLFILEPIKFLTIPIFYIKLGAIALAIVMMLKISNQVFRDPAVQAGRPPTKGKGFAAVTLAAWAVAIFTGRVSAYDAYIQVETGIAVLVVGIVVAIVGAIVARRVSLAADAREAGSARAAAGARRSHA